MVWKAEMILFCDINNEWKNIFKFERQIENYTDNKDEWVYSEGWVSTRISKTITIRSSYCNIIAEVGFDRKLNEQELEDLKKQMKQEIIKYINNKKERYLKIVEEKLKVMNE